MPASENWFEVDREGLAKLVERRGKTFVFAELLQNAYDAPGVTRVVVTTEAVPNRPLVDIIVTDDAPEGFTRLDHAFTLFAESEKRHNAELRGRFNLGEKLVLALCEEAEIRTVRGVITFNHLGRLVSRKGGRAVGSQVAVRIRMTREELAEALLAVQRFIPPIETWVNEKKLLPRAPLDEIETTLVTEWADEAGILRRGPRKTVVRIYEPLPGTTPMLYELGIPVVEFDRYDAEVLQKVPLSMERDSVTPSYLRALRAAVLNAMVHELDQVGAAEPWVTDALEHRDATPETVRRTIVARYGHDAVVFDPSDREANGTAHAHGFTVVHGGAFSREAWERIRGAEALRPAGTVFPTRHPHSNGGNGDPKPVRLTQAMAVFQTLVTDLATQLIGAPIDVSFANEFTERFAAWYGGRRITFNVAHLGKAWFDAALTEAQLDLVLHELGHEYEMDHTSSRYHDALTRLGAKAAILALGSPGMFGAAAAPAPTCVASGVR